MKLPQLISYINTIILVLLVFWNGMFEYANDALSN